MILILQSEIDPVAKEASTLAKRTGKTQFVRAINFDDLFSDIGITDDSEMKIGSLLVTCTPDGRCEYNSSIRK